MTATSFVNAMDDHIEAFDGVDMDSDSGSNLVDLFFALGGSRNVDEVLPLFEKALGVDIDIAVKIVLNARDIREGKGERRVPRTLLRHAVNTVVANSDEALSLCERIVDLGRYDDLFFVFIDTTFENVMLEFYANKLREQDLLAVKWAPKLHSKKEVMRKGAFKLRKLMKLNESGYRKMISSLNNVVEKKMSTNTWEEIEYSHVPSIASARYQQAFMRHDGERYAEYREKLKSGEAKINANAIFPHQVLKAAIEGNSAIANEQWKALPDWIPEGRSFIPVVDVSGSMTWSRGSSSTAPILVAISMGMYCAERNKGPFKNRMITFSRTPSWIKDNPKSGILARYNHILKSPWGDVTNIPGVFKLILDTAVKNNIPQEELPASVVVFTDMAFNSGTTTKTAHRAINRMYEDVGYSPPRFVWWNLSGTSNAPVAYDESGSVLVSGFSPSLLKQVFTLNKNNFNPMALVEYICSSDRYQWRKHKSPKD